MGVPIMDFTDKKYTDFMLLFDNWLAVDNIIATMKRVGLEPPESENEYAVAIKRLIYAKQTYPTIDLHDAYSKSIVEGVTDETLSGITLVNIIQPNTITQHQPCGSCGGGQVR